MILMEHVHNRRQKYMTNSLLNIRARAFKDTYVVGYTTCTRNILIYIIQCIPYMYTYM